MLRGDPGAEWAAGVGLLNAAGPERVMFLSRLPFLLLGAFAGLILWLWGRALLGEAAALAALFLYALDPNIIAHATLVTTDSGHAAFVLLFFFCLWRYLHRRSVPRLLVCGLTLGLVMATKYSVFFLGPVVAVIILAAVRQPPKPDAPTNPRFDPLAAAVPFDRLAAFLGALFVMGVCAFLVLEVLYFFPPNFFFYIAGLGRINADHDPAHLVLLGGHLERKFGSYYAATYLLKEPLASIALAAAGAWIVIFRRSIDFLDTLFLLMPPLVLFAGYSMLSDDMGIRYLVPALPFLYLAGGLALASLFQSRRLRAVAVIACARLVLNAVGIYPDHLSYFNESACAFRDPRQLGLDAGSRCGYFWLDGSNIDWGQGLIQLRRWLAQHPSRQKPFLLYSGLYPAEGYQVFCQAPSDPDHPTAGRYIVSADHLGRQIAYHRRQFGDSPYWLRDATPIAIVGHAYFIYDIP